MKYILIIATLSLMSCQIISGSPPTTDVNDEENKTFAKGDAYFIQSEVILDTTSQEVQ